MLIAADWLRRELPVFAQLSRKAVRAACRPYWRAGWVNRDIVHAMDHRPGVFSQPAGTPIGHTLGIEAPTWFITTRLKAWRRPDGTILPGWHTTRTSMATAKASATARYGRAGVRLLARTGGRELTAELIAEHGRQAAADPYTRAAAILEFQRDREQRLAARRRAAAEPTPLQRKLLAQARDHLADEPATGRGDVAGPVADPVEDLSPEQRWQRARAQAAAERRRRGR